MTVYSSFYSLRYDFDRFGERLTGAFINDPWNIMLVLLIVLSIVLRYPPLVPHGLGIDSFMVQTDLRYSLITHDFYALNYVGFDFNFNRVSDIESLYPFGSPGLLSMILTIFSQILGLSPEHSILYYCMLAGLVGTLTAYIMAAEFSGKHKMVSLMAASSFAMSPLFLSITLWEATFRSIFIILLPMLIWLMLRFDRIGGLKYLLLNVYMLIMLVLAHRLSILLPILVAAYIASRIISYLWTSFALEAIPPKFMKPGEYVIPLAFLLLYAYFFVYPFTSNTPFFKNMAYGYHSGLLAEGDQPQKLFLNMSLDYISSDGVMVLFAIPGIAIFITKLRDIRKNRKYLVITSSMLPFIPMLLKGEYMTLFLLPIFSLLGAYGLKGFLSFTNIIGKIMFRGLNIAPSILILTVIASVITTNFMINYWLTTSYKENVPIKRWMEERTYKTALFLNSIPPYDSRVTAPYIFLGVRMQSMLDKGWGPQGAGVSDYPYKDFKELYWRSRDGFPNGPPSPILYVVEYAGFPGKTEASGNLYDSPFLLSIAKSQDKIYDNSREYVWMLKDEDWSKDH